MGFIELVLAIVVGLAVSFGLLVWLTLWLNRPPRLTAAELDEKVRRDLGF
jgi:hypothetical protein